MTLPYQKLAFKPGLYEGDSRLEAVGYWVDADKVRFMRGLPKAFDAWGKR